MTNIAFMCGTKSAMAVLVWSPPRRTWYGEADEIFHLRVFVRGVERVNVWTRSLSVGIRWVARVVRAIARANGLGVSQFVHRAYPDYARTLLLVWRIQDQLERGQSRIDL